MSKKFQFSEEQIKYIIDNWGIESAYSMKKKFGCTWYAICNVAATNGLKMPESNNWTEEDITNLKKLSLEYHYKDIALLMNKSENAIYLKARRLGITLIQTRKVWSKEDEDMLKDKWGTISIEVLARQMHRTVYSLKVKAVRMGLGPMILNNYDILTVSDLIDTLGVTRDLIMNNWVGAGLNLRKKKMTKNKYYYVVKIEDLWMFLEQNQDLWDSRNLEINSLGLEPDWLVEKRKKDIVENPLWYRRWKAEEILEVEQLFKLGLSYQEIAKRVNRSDDAVACMLRDKGYSYRLPQFWTGKDLLFLKENYANMTYAEIGEILGRTEKAVNAKAEEMGYQKRLYKNKK